MKLGYQVIGDLCHRDLGLGVTFSLFHISDEIEKGKAKSITRRKLNSRVWHFFFFAVIYWSLRSLFSLGATVTQQVQFISFSNKNSERSFWQLNLKEWWGLRWWMQSIHGIARVRVIPTRRIYVLSFPWKRVTTHFPVFAKLREYFLFFKHRRLSNRFIKRLQIVKTTSYSSTPRIEKWPSFSASIVRHVSLSASFSQVQFACYCLVVFSNFTSNFKVRRCSTGPVFPTDKATLYSGWATCNVRVHTDAMRRAYFGITLRILLLFLHEGHAMNGVIVSAATTSGFRQTGSRQRKRRVSSVISPINGQSSVHGRQRQSNQYRSFSDRCRSARRFCVKIGP